jgi:Xaa-Pro aminopeptidase
MKNRLERLRSSMETGGWPALLVSNPVNVSYLSGFTGSFAFLLLTCGRDILLTDSRYLEQARGEAEALEVLDTGPSVWRQVESLLAAEGIVRLALEADHLTLEAFDRLRQVVAGKVALEAVLSPVADLRRVKDGEELASLIAAARLADKAFEHILGFIAPARSEQEIALELEHYMRENGAQRIAFEVIVASGSRSALPHGKAGGKLLAPGDAVVLDFGCVLNGYCSDLSRTVFLGRPNEEQRHVYQAVLAAQGRALAGLRAGISGHEADALARDYLAAEGLAGFFGHGLGHGVGREVHESPRLKAEAEEILKAGMVVTVEPGVYLAGRFGVRIEDVAVIEDGGCRNLTGSSKQLTCI